VAAGAVFVGGGSMIEGCVEAAERVLNMPVRLGVPRDIVGLKDVVATPQFANAVGLLKYGVKMNQYSQGRASRKKAGGGIGAMGSRIRRWFEEYL